MSPAGTSSTASEISTIIEIAEDVAAVAVPGESVAGFTIPEIAALAQGIATGVPEVIAAISDIRSAVSGGAAPTSVQIAALKASVDAANAAIQADAK